MDKDKCREAFEQYIKNLPDLPNKPKLDIIEGRDDDRVIYCYGDTSLAYSDFKHGWEAATKAAIDACEKISMNYHKQYKNTYKSVYDNMSDGAGECAD